MTWLKGNQGPGDWPAVTPDPGGVGSPQGTGWRWVGVWGLHPALRVKCCRPCPHSQQLHSSSYPPTPTPITAEPTSLRSGKIPFPLTLKRKKVENFQKDHVSKAQRETQKWRLGELAGHSWLC
jgi:hypothetical protein